MSQVIENLVQIGGNMWKHKALPQTAEMVAFLKNPHFQLKDHSFTNEKLLVQGYVCQLCTVVGTLTQETFAKDVISVKMSTAVSR